MFNHWLLTTIVIYEIYVLLIDHDNKGSSLIFNYNHNWGKINLFQP